MVKLFKATLLCLALVLLLAACGQGTNDTTNEQPVEEPDTVSGDEGNEDIENDLPETETEEIVEPIEEPEIVQTVTLYFSDNDLMDIYRVEREIRIATEEDLAIEALQAWIEGPNQEDLTNLLPEGVEVQSIDEVDGIAHVSFSSELLKANLGSSGEAFLLDQIAMIMEQFGYQETLLLIDGEIVPEFLGHIDTSEPIQAGSPEQYEIKS